VEQASELLLYLALTLACIFPCCMTYAACSDLVRMEIPNWASIAPALAYLPYALLTNQPILATGLHYAVGVGVFGVGVVLFAMRVMGGGDVKLLGAAAIWIGWDLVAPYVFLVAVSGGVLSLFALALRRPFFKFLFRPLPWTDPAHPPKIPYGLAIGASAILLFPRTPGLAGAWETLTRAL
jgi:prepilin peptidase CpaA